MEWWRKQSTAMKWMDAYGMMALLCIVVGLTLGVEDWPWVARSFGAGFGFCAGGAALIYMRQRGRGWWNGVWTFWTGLMSWGIVGSGKDRSSPPKREIPRHEYWIVLGIVVVLSAGAGCWAKWSAEQKAEELEELMQRATVVEE